MSVSDPLIKELKGWTRKLTECNTGIDDNNVNLPPFCKTLERCFQKGLLMRLNAIGFPKMPEAWYWMEEFADKNECSYAFTSAVALVRQNSKVQSPIGRLRLLLRICLNRKCLHVPIQLLVRSPSMSLEFYGINSILGDEILAEILLSVLLQGSKLNFKLNLRNASFLDETWQLPECIAIELVPCKTMGISVTFTQGKALIVNLQENSVAAEDEKIESGDILDEINGTAITTSSKGKLGKIMKRAAGQPVSVHIIKHRYKQSGDLFGPIVNLIRNTGIERVQSILRSPKTVSVEGRDSKRLENAKSDNQSLKVGFEVRFCGVVTTGIQGDVRQIEKAIWRLLQSGDSKLTPVRFECLEIGIRVTQDDDDVVILKHTYMEISSCGRTANIPDYFAYIAGDSNCDAASKFDAYVFYHQKEDEVQTILQSLGQGFQRTHFAV